MKQSKQWHQAEETDFPGASEATVLVASKAEPGLVGEQWLSPTASPYNGELYHHTVCLIRITHIRTHPSWSEVSELSQNKT